jgi:hypothetical protein
MRDVSPHPQDFTELALHAFADNGYVPSVAVLKAVAKNLARLSDPLPCAVRADANAVVSFDEMLRSCAGV